MSPLVASRPRRRDTEAKAAAPERGLRLLVFSAEAPATGYGSATALRSFAVAAARLAAWDLTIVIPADGGRGAGPDVGPRGQADERVRYVRLPVGPLPWRSTRLLGYGCMAAARAITLAAGRPDVVIGWQPVPAGLAAMLAARRARRSCLIRTCGPELTAAWGRFAFAAVALRPLTRAVLRGADAIVVKSATEEHLLRRLGVHEVFRIPNAVSENFFADSPRQDAGAGDELRLITVCQLEPHKGVGRMLAAIAPGRLPLRCHLTVVGDGSQYRALAAAADSLGVAASFPGRIPHSELPAVYAAHDAFVLASSLEACSNAVLEAMASGLPVIGAASAVGDLVADGVCGMLADGSGTDELTEAIARLVAVPSRIPSMRAAARLVAAEHSPERLIADYQQVIRLARRGRGG